MIERIYFHERKGEKPIIYIKKTTSKHPKFNLRPNSDYTEYASRFVTSENPVQFQPEIGMQLWERNVSNAVIYKHPPELGDGQFIRYHI